MGDVFHDDHAVQAVDLSRQVGVWTWDIRADILTGDARLASLFSIDPQRIRQGIPLEHVLSRIHRGDRASVDVAIASSIQLSSEYIASYRVEADNGTRWLQAHGRCFSASGEPRLLSGIVFDVSGFRSSAGAAWRRASAARSLDTIAAHCLAAHRIAGDVGLVRVTSLLRPLLHELGKRISQHLY